jgi:ATP-dependent Clp protease, protease subunit
MKELPMSPLLRLMLTNKGRGSFKAEGGTLWLYDVIASDDDEAEWWGGISPRQFIGALHSMSGPVTLRINSPGGSVFGAQAMVAAMRDYDGPITARVDALAASAASVIAAEAAHLEMAQGSMLMIHKAWSLAIGNADDMRSTADLLEKIDGQISGTYARKGGDKDWAAMMAAETWFDADEAVAAGLADRVLSESKQKNLWDLSAFKAAPWQPAQKTPESDGEQPETASEQPQVEEPAEMAAKERTRRLMLARVKGI